MDDTLTIQLFLFTTMVAIALDAYKAQGRPQIALWMFAAIFGFAGLFWGLVTERWANLKTTAEQIASSPTSWFILSVALYFVGRPYWNNAGRDKPAAGLSSGQPDETRELLKKHTALIESQIEKRVAIEKRLEEIDREVSKRDKDQTALLSDYRRVASIEANLLEHIDAVKKGSRDYSKGLFDTLRSEIAVQAAEKDGIGSDLTKRLTEQKERLQDLEESVEAHRQAQRFSILAIYHRERLLTAAREIEEIADNLKQRVKGGASLSKQEWGSWLANYQLWLANTNRWSDFAIFYFGKDPTDEIQRLHPTDFDGDWNVTHDQFPNPEDIRRYKEFCIFHRNWEAVSKVVHDKVRRQAFEGQQRAEMELVTTRNQ